MRSVLSVCLAAGALAACGPSRTNQTPDASVPDASECPRRCSDDLHQVLDCEDDVVAECAGDQACDVSQGACTNACQAAEANRRSIGCDYYAVHMDTVEPDYCFAVFVANTWTAPAKIAVEYAGQKLPIESFARRPVGSGPALTYAPYSAATGIAPGEVAILFLGGGSGAPPLCPTPTAVAAARRNGNAIAHAYHITTDVPVVAYQMSPYGGGSVAVTAASLLLPTSAWDTSYVAVNASPATASSPSLNIVAREDGTVATITPNAPIAGGNGVPAAAAGTPVQISLARGQHVQITQRAELTGSVVTSNKPVGFFAGHQCMNMPVGVSFCDHGEQMVPPTRALGHQYVGVMYRPRVAQETTTFWRLIGTVDGTALTWSTNVGGPTTLNKGQSVIFETGTPFFVSSQDRDHPFMLFNYMTGSTRVSSGYGDPDFVLSVPPAQYLKQYTFFTDPTYPETNLVLVRARDEGGQYQDVILDCLGPVQGWQDVTAEYQYTRVDLSRGNFAPVGNCSTGRHEVRSLAPFGLWVWGWGTPETSSFTQHVSYGYPGGMNIARINDVVVN